MPRSQLGPHDQELVERFSQEKRDIDATSPAYVDAKTPKTDELEDGAIRAGGTPNVLSREYVGVLIQYAGIGVVYGAVYAVIYPFLNNYLRISGVATASASVLTTLPWTLNAFLGVITDCFPIFGYRRRPYMVIGWTVCAICTLVMACMPIGDPYYPDPEYAFKDVATLSEEQVASFNRDAPNTGTKFIILMILADIGMVFASTAVNGMVIELSQREAVNVRGTIQTMVWVSKMLFGIGATAMAGFGLNSADFGGSFAGDMGINAIFGICCAASLISAAGAWYFIAEEKHAGLKFGDEVGKLFGMLQEQVVYQLIAFRFFHNMFSYITVTAALPLQSVWAGVEPVNSSIAAIISTVISASGLLIIKQFGLNWNWRYAVIITQILVVAIDCIPVFFTIWDVVRSQWFYLGLPLVAEIPDTVGWIVTIYAMIEVIEEGSEATGHGLISGVSTLASPFAAVVTKAIDQNFEIALTDLQRDDTEVRNQVTYAYLIAYIFNLASVLFVVLLPRQKLETQQLKKDGSKNFWAGVVVAVIIAFVYIWSIMTNLMSIFPSTACLKVAGGNGC